MTESLEAFDIDNIGIFDDSKIIAGVTKRNLKMFPPIGFNISLMAGIDEDIVKLHRGFLAEYLGFEIENLKFQKQVHGRNIRILDLFSREEESDAMVTTEKGLLLCVSIADCAAVLIHDPQNGIIAAIHSGWRGTQENISSEAIDLLKEKFSSDTSYLKTFISPCASGSKYEVDWDVAKLFPRSVKPGNNGKFLFDNRNEIYNQLIDSGIHPDNIEVSKQCTISDYAYHSWRRDRDDSGRMAAFIGMK
jgi:purine-nucleoside/S-methyl-5'-thioadenosine phosphorylase / adenosine deaminase